MQGSVKESETKDSGVTVECRRIALGAWCKHDPAQPSASTRFLLAWVD
jgi:hypothetical protein